jgi:hypothetical protein
VGTWGIEDRARSAATSAGAEVAPWVEKLARVGYAAKAVLYATVGVLAARAAFGTGGRTTDTRGALGSILGAPFGRVLLVIIGLGLLGYAAWRIVQAVTDPERRGTDPKGLALRASYVLRGLLHAALAVSALRLASGGGRSGGGSGEGSERWTGRALELPGGEVLVWLVGAGIVGYGLYQLYRAYAAKLSKELDIGRLSADAGRWLIGVSRFGIAARGVVFTLIGVFLLRAAMRHDAQQAGGLADSLATLGGAGRWPLAAVAIGLVAYGAYELVNAKYRRIRAA